MSTQRTVCDCRAAMVSRKGYLLAIAMLVSPAALAATPVNMDVKAVPFDVTGTINGVDAGDIVGFPDFDVRLGTLAPVILGGTYSVVPRDIAYVGPDLPDGALSTFFARADFDFTRYAPAASPVRIQQIFGFRCVSDDGSSCPSPLFLPAFVLPGTVTSTNLGSSLTKPATVSWTTSSTDATIGTYEGRFTFNGEFTIQRTYLPKTTKEYVRDFTAEASIECCVNA
jgi:hypothetical protein